MVMTLRAEMGMKYGTVKRVAQHFGYGEEAVRFSAPRVVDLLVWQPRSR
jgi:hypothetical protein